MTDAGDRSRSPDREPDHREGKAPLAVIVTAPRVDADPELLRGQERDTVCLTWEERRWARRRLTTTKGREIALALPTGSVLRAGDVISVSAEWYLAVEARPEPVLVLAPSDRAEAVRIAFEVGNRHFPLAVDGDLLLVPDDSAMTQLASRTGVRWERATRVFEPGSLGASPAHAEHAPHESSRRG